MATLTIRLPNDKHERLRLLARRRRISMNKLINVALLAALARLAII
jgi:predicted HicB family RNase H-like nuclease